MLASACLATTGASAPTIICRGRIDFEHGCDIGTVLRILTSRRQRQKLMDSRRQVLFGKTSAISLETLGDAK